MGDLVLVVGEPLLDPAVGAFPLDVAGRGPAVPERVDDEPVPVAVDRAAGQSTGAPIGRYLSRQAARPYGTVGRLIGWNWIRETAAVDDTAIELLNPQAGERIGEIGLGPGRTIARIAATGAKVTGVDVSPAMVAAATRRNAVAVEAGKVRLHHGDGATIPVADHTIDGVLSVHSAYFWPRPSFTLCIAVERPGGVTVAVSHPVFARVYQRMSTVMDRAGGADLCHALVAGLSGRVIEIGAGNGRTFAHYPTQVTEVVAVEPEPRLRAAALDAARTAPVPVRVVDGLADALPATDGEFDAAVTALVLCTVPDQAAALTEIRRALRPRGQLHFLEHIAATTPGAMRRAQRLADATLWPILLGGCHTSRDTVTAITTAGFTIDDIHHFRFPATGPPSPAAPHVRGTATRPDDKATP